MLILRLKLEASAEGREESLVSVEMSVLWSEEVSVEENSCWIERCWSVSKISIEVLGNLVDEMIFGGGAIGGSSHG